MKCSRSYLSTLLAIVTLAGFALFHAPEAQAGVRVIRTPSHHHGYHGGHCAPVYRAPVHHCTYTLQQRRVFIGYDHFGRPLYQIHYVQVKTCGCR
jgi:hypothetical protein